VHARPVQGGVAQVVDERRDDAAVSAVERTERKGGRDRRERRALGRWR
jgi:hypothetical protein